MSTAELIVREHDGCVIQQRPADGYFEITSVCAKYGKRPRHWLETKAAKENLKRVSAFTGIPVNELVITRQGPIENGGGTWMHPKAFYRMAIWLDDDLAFVAANWIQEFHETGQVRELGDPQTAVALRSMIDSVDALGRLVASGFTSVGQKVDGIESRLCDVEHKVDRFIPRRAFKPSTEAEWIECVNQWYSRRCPCCESTIISGGFYQADHFYSRSKNSKRDGWPVCKQCHDGLTNGDLRDNKQHMFKTFQDRLARTNALPFTW